MLIWTKIVEFSQKKLNLTYLQKIIYGVLGGIFIGLGFTAFYMITLKATDVGIGLFLGSIMFAVGIVMCVILGGALITTNCLTLSCALVKKSEIKKHLIDLGIVTVTNWIGAGLIGLIVYYTGIFDTSSELHDKFIAAINAKNNLSWYKVLLSALLTNLLVAGGVICYNAADNKAVGIVALIMCIATFVIAGFNHVVANMYFSIISLLATGKCNFLTLILLAFIGNVLSGYFLVFSFYFINKSETRKLTTK